MGSTPTCAPIKTKDDTDAGVVFASCGEYGSRTHDLLHAMQAL